MTMVVVVVMVMVVVIRTCIFKKAKIFLVAFLI
jgi:hypothetical protein